MHVRAIRFPLRLVRAQLPQPTPTHEENVLFIPPFVEAAHHEMLVNLERTSTESPEWQICEKAVVKQGGETRPLLFIGIMTEW